MEKICLRIIIGCVLLPLLFFPPIIFHGKSRLFKDFDHPRLVETQELVGLIDHASIRMIDMRSSLLDYLKGHIPNAIYLHFENLQAPQDGIPAQSPDRICLERLIWDALSLSNDMWAIVYSEKSNPNATFLAWSLDFLDHKKVAILNGGWEKWALENLPMTQEYPSLPPKHFTGKVIRERLAEKKWIRDRLSTRGTVIVDTRPSKQYSGEEGEEIRKGHIPGAKNVFWETTLEGNEVKVWRKKEDLERLFAEADVTKDKEVVVYGRTGMEASHVYFTLRYVLRYPHVRLYRGSWIEWSADKNLPIKTGTDP
jgi:thiosulfate/3-mercaptopyruvate sulfurtransferase